MNFDNGISGKVNISINETLNKTVEIVNNSAVLYVSDLNVGQYTVKITYLNEKFTSEEIIASFSVGKSKLILNVDAFDVTVYDDQIIKVSNLKDATGNLTFKINQNEYIEEIKGSEIILNLSKLTEGNYSLVINYTGDSNYYDSYFTTMFHVKEKVSEIILKVKNSAYGEDITAVATVNDNATGIVRFTIGNISKDIEIVNGTAKWVFSGIDVGVYNITAMYLGNHYYISSLTHFF